jgi:hypothetical protein
MWDLDFFLSLESALEAENRYLAELCRGPFRVYILVQ